MHHLFGGLLRANLKYAAVIRAFDGRRGIGIARRKLGRLQRASQRLTDRFNAPTESPKNDAPGAVHHRFQARVAFGPPASPVILRSTRGNFRASGKTRAIVV